MVDTNFNTLQKGGRRGPYYQKMDHIHGVVTLVLKSLHLDGTHLLGFCNLCPLFVYV